MEGAAEGRTERAKETPVKGRVRFTSLGSLFQKISNLLKNKKLGAQHVRID